MLNLINFADSLNMYKKIFKGEVAAHILSLFF